MPLKRVGCQVIEETQPAQPHRLRSRRASPAAERGERHGMRATERERDPIIRRGGLGRGAARAQRNRMGDRGAAVVGSL